jgi:hypothetical protein
MNRLEDELKNALRRKEPPPDFAERLLARIPVSPVPKSGGWQSLLSLFRSPKRRWVAAAVVTCLFVWIGIVQYRKYQEVKVEGEMAKTQVMLALHIASTKLNLVQKAVLEKVSRVPLSQPKESQ